MLTFSGVSVTTRQRLVVWTLLDTGLRVSEFRSLTFKNMRWQQRQLRLKDKGGPTGRNFRYNC